MNLFKRLFGRKRPKLRTSRVYLDSYYVFYETWVPDMTTATIMPQYNCFYRTKMVDSRMDYKRKKQPTDWEYISTTRLEVSKDQGVRFILGLISWDDLGDNQVSQETGAKSET